jgi:hypothetical protein
VVEKTLWGFPGWVAVRKFLETSASSMRSAVFVVVSDWEKESAGLNLNNFHREFTGNAERQFPVCNETKEQPRIFTDFH